MSNKTIAKICSVVILFAFCCGGFLSCSRASSNGRYAVNSAELSTDYEKPVTIGRIESSEITESSGLASSLCQPNVLWTHNDSGGDAFIFAIDLKGKHLGTWRVTNSRNDDWEDMAAYKGASGECYLYIGDIGNNKLARAEQTIYRVKEPEVPSGEGDSSRKNPLQTEPAEAFSYRYPGPPHDAETMMAQPQTGDIYILTKRIDGPSIVYKLKPHFGSPSSNRAERIAELSLPAVPNGLLTGGSISPDGKRVIVCDYSAGYELDLGDAVAFDEVWKQKPVAVDLGDRRQGEAVTFSRDGRSVYATSERKNSPLIEAKRK
jgi:hypothetical protein